MSTIGVAVNRELVAEGVTAGIITLGKNTVVAACALILIGRLPGDHIAAVREAADRWILLVVVGKGIDAKLLAF